MNMPNPNPITIAWMNNAGTDAHTSGTRYESAMMRAEAITNGLRRPILSDHRPAITIAISAPGTPARESNGAVVAAWPALRAGVT